MKDFIHKRNKFLLFFNKSKGFYMALPYDLNYLSLSRLRNKLLLATKIKWKLFVTITFSREEYVLFNGIKITPDFPIRINGKVHHYDGTMYFDRPRAVQFSKCLRNLDYGVSGDLLSPIIDNLRAQFGNEWAYSWRYEEGGRTGNCHFHMIFDDKFPLCVHTFFHWLSDHWNGGTVDVRRCWNQEGLKHYIFKEFSKSNKFEKFRGTRRWATSKGMELEEKISDFEWQSSAITQQEAFIVNSMFADSIDQHVGEGFSKKILKAVLKHR